MADAAPSLPPDATSMAAPLDKAAGAVNLDSLISAQIRESKSAAGAIEKDRADVQSQYGNLDATVKKMEELNASRPKPPGEAFKPPEEKDPMSAWGSVAMALAFIASARTRSPLTSMLKASAAGINAIKQGNTEAYEKAEKIWKENNEFTQKQWEMENDQYKEGIDLMKTDVDLGLAKIRTTASMMQDEPVLASLRAGGDKAVELLMKRMEMQQSMALKGALLSDRADKTKVQMELMKANRGRIEAQKSGDPVAIAKAKDAWDLAQSDAQAYLESEGKALPDGAGGGDNPNVLQGSDLDYQAQTYRATGKMPPMGLGSKGPALTNRENIQKRANQLASIERRGEALPDGALNAMYDVGGSAAVKADEGSLKNIQKMTDAAVSYENTASKNFDLAMTLAPAAVPDMGPFMNRWIEQGETMFGDEDVPPYVTALLTGANEYAKIMSGSTGAQGSTVDSRREAAERFSPYLNQGQIKAVVKVAQQDMDNRKETLQGQIDTIKGRITNRGQGSSSSDKKYAVGDTLQHGGKTYRVTGGDPSDPDVEEVK